MKSEKKRLTLRQIAQLARTSKSTVSRVLTNHPSVSPQTRTRIEAAIEKHGYLPNLFARGLAGGKTGLIAAIASEINSGFFAEVLKGVDQVVHQNGGHVLSSFAHGAEDYIRLWKDMSEQGRADAIVLIAPPVELLAEPFEDSTLPCLLCACRPTRAAKGWDGVSSVTVGNRQGMTEILQHLAERGCKNIVHLSGPKNIFDSQERIQGVKAFAALRPGLTVDIVQAGQTRDVGYAAVIDYLSKHKDPPDAIVAFNDATAYGALQALKEMNIAVPDRTRVTGCDDEDSASAVGLTTLHMNMVNVGQEAARLIYRSLNNREARQPAEHVIIDMQVKVRSTT